MAVKEEVSLPAQRICIRCNFVSSQEVCKACVLLEGLNKGLPRLGIGKTSKAKKMLEEYDAKQNGDLEDAVLELKDDNSCKSKGKTCRTGMCKSKNTEEKTYEEINNKENKCNNCSGTCQSTCSKDKGVSKINTLLQQYGIDETIDRTIDSVKVQTNGVVDSSDEEDVIEEDNTCAGACGSVNIGF